MPDLVKSSSPDWHPFRLIALGDGEALIWCGKHPTFHRTYHYAIAASSQAVYLYLLWFIVLARWRRIPLETIREVQFRDSEFRPRLDVKTAARTWRLTTPYDNPEDMEWDRRVLETAEVEIKKQLQLFKFSDQ